MAGLGNVALFTAYKTAATHSLFELAFRHHGHEYPTRNDNTPKKRKKKKERR